MVAGSTPREAPGGELHPTREHSLHNPSLPAGELTVRNAPQPEKSPCRRALRDEDVYKREDRLPAKTPPGGHLRCLRCGKCCVTDLFAFMTDEDTARWDSEGREDILHILENESALWAGDRIVSRRNGHPLQTCPFLALDGGLATCTIYATRPKVCRDYAPGTSEWCPHFERTTA